MTSQVVMTLLQAAAGSEVQSPSGLGQGQTQFSILDANGTDVVPKQLVSGLTATFDGIADGTFTAQGQLLDTAGNPLGSPVSAQFVDGVQTPPPPPATATYLPLLSIQVTVTPDAASTGAASTGSAS